MGEHELSGDWRVILNEIRRTLESLPADDVAAFEDELLSAQRIFVTGEGRSGLVARAFAMRLLHLGLSSHVAGDTAAPAAGPGDLLVAVSGSGATGVTRARVEAARRAGVRVAVVTATARSALFRLADRHLRLRLPESQQYGGSLFEQSALLFFDAVALHLQRRLGQSAADMGARHATLE